MCVDNIDETKLSIIIVIVNILCVIHRKYYRIYVRAFFFRICIAWFLLVHCEKIRGSGGENRKSDKNKRGCVKGECINPYGWSRVVKPLRLGGSFVSKIRFRGMQFCGNDRRPRILRSGSRVP